jgi:anti-anti-sigma regulatory factor
MANTKKQRKKLNIANLLAPIIGSRDVVDILEKVINKTNAESVDLDFSDVKFISRSAAHALLLMKEKLRIKKEVSFINTDKDVANMLRAVAANRAVSKKEKPQFNPQKISINSLLKEVLV